MFERLAHALTLAGCEQSGREASPTVRIIDAQAARSGGVRVAGECSYDPAHWIEGRKRHALNNTDSRLLLALASPAALHDTHGGIALLRASGGLFPFLAHYFAHRAYRRERVSTATAVVELEAGRKGFAVRPRQYVIERTFSWISRRWSLAHAHETTVSSTPAFFVLAAAMILVRRLARAYETASDSSANDPFQVPPLCRFYP